MKRNVLIASVSALALSATAAFAGSGCGDADLMEQAAMSVGSGGSVQLAQTQEGEKTEVKPGEGQGPTEAVGGQVEGADKDKKAGEASEKAGHESPTEAVGEATPEMKPDGDAPAAGGAGNMADDAAKPAGDAAKQEGNKTEVKPGEGQGPTEAVGDAAKQSEDQPKDQSEVTQEGDKTKVKPAESPTPAQ